jgi:hypothetical protein
MLIKDDYLLSKTGLGVADFMVRYRQESGNPPGGI